MDWKVAGAEAVERGAHCGLAREQQDHVASRTLLVYRCLLKETVEQPQVGVAFIAQLADGREGLGEGGAACELLSRVVKAPDRVARCMCGTCLVRCTDGLEDRQRARRRRCAAQ